MQRVVGLAFFVAGVALAAAALALHRQHAPADYSALAACIGDARVSHPLADLHQELVNALYECGVYKLDLG